MRPELWRKLERRLDDSDRPIRKTKFMWRPWVIAASFLLLVGFATVLRSGSTYTVEDLESNILPGFTKEQLVFDDLSGSLPVGFNG